MSSKDKRKFVRISSLNLSYVLVDGNQENAGKQTMGRFFRLLDGQLADNPFVAGSAFTIADITAFVTIEFAKRVDIAIPDDGADNVLRWHGEIAARPSASA